VAANARIGIDIEVIGRDLSEDFTKGVFTQEELELAAHTGEAPTAILRFWCAKEAISKALGTGIRYSPQDLRVTAVDAVTGDVRIELLGQWLEPFKHLKGRKNVIHTALYEGHAVATCLLPASSLKHRNKPACGLLLHNIQYGTDGCAASPAETLVRSTPPLSQHHRFVRHMDPAIIGLVEVDAGSSARSARTRLKSLPTTSTIFHCTA
jgi:phosphopantetheine--protein transferase-like protein